MTYETTDPVQLRVLKEHTEAVRTTIDGFGRPYRDDPEAFHAEMAAAVLAASDSRTRYVVVVQTADGPQVFGPYAGYRTASNVLAVGLPIIGPACIRPLIPAPKLARKAPGAPRGAKG